MSLPEIIAERIHTSGPISVAEYMSLCLTHPEFGYYMRKDPFGTQGDFITAPEVSQVFGELVGLWLAAQWEKLGKPKATLAELGPGRGTLMADMLRATRKITGFHESINVRLLEISPVLKQKQWHALAGKHPDIEWVDTLDDLPPRPLLLAANEFFDALPIRQFVYISSPLEGEDKGGGNWRERLVGLKNDKLVFVLSNTNPQPPPTLTLPLKGGGEWVETCQPALDMIATVAQHIAEHKGAALVIDYGYTENGKGNTLQAMRQHHYHDVLAAPGEADITAHVNFTSLKQAAENTGARVHGAIPQGKFLMGIGAGQRVQKLCATATPEQSSALISGLERLASPDKMGDLFKVLAITSPDISHAEGF